MVQEDLIGWPRGSCQRENELNKWVKMMPPWWDPPPQSRSSTKTIQNCFVGKKAFKWPGDPFSRVKFDNTRFECVFLLTCMRDSCWGHLAESNPGRHCSEVRGPKMAARGSRQHSKEPPALTEGTRAPKASTTAPMCTNTNITKITFTLELWSIWWEEM